MTIRSQINANRWRTLVVMFGFALITLALMLVIAGAFDPGFASIIGIVMIVYGAISWFASGKLIASISGAKPITRAEHRELWNAVDNASIAAGLAKTPDVYIIQDDAPNAFAAGRNPKTAYVAATTGLLALLDKRELEGVMAHEIAHVRNRDVALMSIAAVLTGSIVLACDMLIRATIFGGNRRNSNNNPIGLILMIVVIVLAPILAGLMQMALSRKREYLADASAVQITGDAQGLAGALQKLADDHTPLEKVTRATAHMYIESPLRDNKKLRAGIGGLFDTHPPIEKRIAALHEMGGLDT